MRLIFAGTPHLARLVLQKLLDASFIPAAVFCQPDRRAGRGRHLTACPVKELALEQGIPCHQPLTLKQDHTAKILQDYQPDVMVVAAYGLLLPQRILDIPKHGCINVHASLLPRWRGASPIQQALLAGDKQTGISLMQMNRGLDTGDVIVQQGFDITDDDNASTLHDKLADLGGDLTVNYLTQLAAGTTLPKTKQDDTQATHAPKISKEDATIDWQNDANTIERQVRAYHGWPVAHGELQSEYVRIWQAKAHPCPTHWQHHMPGTILGYREGTCWVRCGEGALAIEQMQLANHAVWSAEQLHQRRPAWFNQPS